MTLSKASIETAFGSYDWYTKLCATQPRKGVTLDGDCLQKLECSEEHRLSYQIEWSDVTSSLFFQ